MITNTMDEYSDLDLIIVCKEEEFTHLMKERDQIIRKTGHILSAFSGEHVGDPRLMICLYKQPLLHVDYKFIILNDLKERIENPCIIFERDNSISALMEKTIPHHPMPDIQWIEDRFWTWIHYATLKLGRGEFLEITDFLSFLRGNVFGPLALVLNKQLPRGVRRIELLAKNYSEDIKSTVAIPEKQSCILGIEKSIELYLRLRNDVHSTTLVKNNEAEKEVVDFFNRIKN